MDWINKEADRIKNEDAAKQQYQQKQKSIQAQSWTLWEKLRAMIEQAVAQLNASPEISKRIGAVEFNGHNNQIVSIVNQQIPAVYITIKYAMDGVQVERKRRPRVDGDFDYYNETLQYDMDQNGRIVFRTEHEKMMLIEQSAEYILKPLVRKHDDLAFSFPAS